MTNNNSAVTTTRLGYMKVLKDHVQTISGLNLTTCEMYRQGQKHLGDLRSVKNASFTEKRSENKINGGQSLSNRLSALSLCKNKKIKRTNRSDINEVLKLETNFRNPRWPLSPASLTFSHRK